MRKTPLAHPSSPPVVRVGDDLSRGRHVARRLPATKDILYFLIARTGEQLGITETNFPQHAEGAGLSARNARRWLTGDVCNLNAHSRQLLAQIFRPALPTLKAEWFGKLDT